MGRTRGDNRYYFYPTVAGIYLPCLAFFELLYKIKNKYYLWSAGSDSLLHFNQEKTGKKN